jgi:hypothetical protein
MGPTLSGTGHVHAAPGQADGGSPHLDHVHLAFGASVHGHGHHHDDPGPATERELDHDGEDAVSRNPGGFQARPTRVLPAMETAAFAVAPPCAASPLSPDRQLIPLQASRSGAPPPGRAPPA